jgi:hypothetical protein
VSGDQTFTDRNGRTWRACGPRPYMVRCNRDRWFGSLEAARAYARTVQGHYSIFFDFAPGTGAFVESSIKPAVAS